MAYFTDEHRHPYFHTNNLWFDLRALADTLAERHGVLGLPMIKNVKTVDPSDPNSPEVVQIESAMGAAIEVFEGATAIGVGRERFLPVKTTNDLLVLRSDVYEVASDGRLVQQDAPAPLVDLDSRFYKTIAGFEKRFGEGAPSLKEAQRLKVEGDWTFGAGVAVVGDVTLSDPGEPQTVPAGSTLSPTS
jgi:UTP--glucose-1-phosphate uridylyltransferase